MRTLAYVLVVAALAAGCVPQEVRPPRPAHEPPPSVPAPLAAPTETRGRFTIEADKLDTWNAVGQIVVRTPGVTYEGRAQMLDLYSVRYRGQAFLILTRALRLSAIIKNITTEVTAATPGGNPIDSDASADLLALLQRELPAEIQLVREKQAEKKAKAQQAKKKKKSLPTRTRP